jgi:NAD+ synthase (glutamine-hydrolysing)
MLLALAQINPILGGFSHNRKKIINAIEAARAQGADIVLFPELALCGYAPEDLLLLPEFVAKMEEELLLIAEASHDIIVIVGLARKNPYGGEKRLLNSACVIENGTILGFQDKILLPDYDVFSERRYFDPGKATHIWTLKGKRVAILICEDIWQHGGLLEYVSYARDPVKMLVGEQIDLVLNLSASPFFIGHEHARQKVCGEVARTLNCPMALVNQVGGNDSLIFDGRSLFVRSDGSIVQRAKAFEEDLLLCEVENKTVIQCDDDPMEDLFNALVMGTRDYFRKVGYRSAIFGLSGGIDSALVAVILVHALGRENVKALFMPSRYTSVESKEDALRQAEILGIIYETLSIEAPFKSYLELLYPKIQTSGVAEENLQARVRGMLLMAYSNQLGYMVIGTGNKSELAMGYSTLYGDMCGGLEIIGDVKKSWVNALCRWLNRKEEVIVKRILEKEPSAELKADQKDSDSLPPYEIVDRVLEAYVHDHLSPTEIATKEKLELSLVKELVRKIHSNEYKRQQAPPSLRVTKRSFSEGRRFPIAQQWNITNHDSE